MAGYEKYINDRVVSRRTETSQHPVKESEQPPKFSPLEKKKAMDIAVQEERKSELARIMSNIDAANIQSKVKKVNTWYEEKK